MSYYLYIFLLIILIGFSYNCKDENIKPIDCEIKGGCEVMNCKLNGKFWSAHCDQSNPWGCNDIVDCNYDLKSGFLSIRGSSSKNPAAGVVFHSPIFGGNFIGLQSLSNQTVVGCADCIILNVDNGPYELDSIYLAGQHLEIIRIDSIYRLIEGRFNFRAINSINKDTIYVTDGYFKLTYF